MASSTCGYRDQSRTRSTATRSGGCLCCWSRAALAAYVTHSELRRLRDGDGLWDSTFNNASASTLRSFNYIIGRPRLRIVRTSPVSCDLPGVFAVCLPLRLRRRMTHAERWRADSAAMEAVLLDGQVTCFRTYDDMDVDRSPYIVGDIVIPFGEADVPRYTCVALS